MLSMKIPRIEGEGEITLYIDDNGIVNDVEYKIIESPRFFEYIIKGKHYTLIPDLLSRVCGYCGVSYILMSALAFEKAGEFDVSETFEKYREVIHLLERLKSHVIHICVMNLPDVLNISSIIELKRRNPLLFNQIVTLLNLVNNLTKLIMGRIHNTVNIRIGGVYKFPEPSVLLKAERILVNEFKPIFMNIAELILGSDNIPSHNQQLVYCALKSSGYPHHGVDIECNDTEFNIHEFYEKKVTIEQKIGKTSLLYKLDGKGFVVGPLARFNKNYSTLIDETKEMLRRYGWLKKLSNTYQAVIARIAEVYDIIARITYEVPDLISNYPRLEQPISHLEKPLNKDLCYYAVEAPRGILYGRFRVMRNGEITESNIITPTAQNIASMEEIARRELVGLKHDYALKTAMKIAVSFDPCISCSVHKVYIKRSIHSYE
ncbi:MAG: nickel-dependent hydrogenase large subunit [Desulfurococcaceae archaeon]